MIKPYCIQVELTEGCNLNCDFCGIHSLYKKYGKEKKFMSVELADKLSKELNEWLGKGRVEFAMHGEPLLNENCNKIIQIFRNNFKKSQLSLFTNGIPLLKNDTLKNIKKIFDSGLNILCIDCYNTYNIFRKKIDEKKLLSMGIDVIEYYKEKFNIYQYHNNKIKKLVLIGDISKFNDVKKQRKITNHAGSAPKENAIKYGYKILIKPLKKKCYKLFREMSIEYNGRVGICCIDWKKELTIGKFPEQKIKDIWESEKFMKYRRLIYKKNRNFLPCSKCDYNGGFRLGLLKRWEKFLWEDEKNDMDGKIQAKLF